MTKKEAEAVGVLAVIGAIVYPFVWLYEQIGVQGLVLCAAGVVAAAAYWHLRHKQQDQKAFEALVRYVLHNRLPPEEARRINRRLEKDSFQRLALIRNLQIIRDSIELALSSKKRDTAESRIQLVAELRQEVQHGAAELVSEAVSAEIDQVCAQALAEFNTALFLNIAAGHVEKAASLKTDKSKAKYLALAAEVLNEGLALGRGDLAALQSALTEVEARQAESA